jgi:hypothetical protein
MQTLRDVLTAGDLVQPMAAREAPEMPMSEPMGVPV